MLERCNRGPQPLQPVFSMNARSPSVSRVADLISSARAIADDSPLEASLFHLRPHRSKGVVTRHFYIMAAACNFKHRERSIQLEPFVWWTHDTDLVVVGLCL